MNPSFPIPITDIHPANRIPPLQELPVTTPHTTPEKPPLYVSPFTSRVNELPPKARSRAYSASSRVAEALERRIVKTKYPKMLAFKEINSMPKRGPSSRRTASTPISRSPPLETMDTALPPGHRGLIRRPTRLIVSAPPIPQSVLGRLVPGVPMGNAWSGEHYWAPQFSPQLVVPREEIIRDPDDLLTPVQPVSRAAYYSVRDSVQSLASNLSDEAERYGETTSPNECNVIAAERVLDDKNAECAVSGGLPSPRSISSRVFELGVEETRATSYFGVETSADLRDTDVWLRIDETTPIQVSTILDSAKEALAMLRRKNRDLELSVPAYSVVYALQILEDKRRKWKRGSWESEESDDDFEYGMFLKSIQEELSEEANKREISGGTREVRVEGEQKQTKVKDGPEEETDPRVKRTAGLVNRRLRGKAPSVLDLASWAEELKKMEDDSEAREEEGEIGRAITKDD
jgi:hypothetical protein